MRVYLSGGMEYANERIFVWRFEIEKWLMENLNHFVFNPVIETQKFLEENYPDILNFRELKVTSPEKFTEIIRRIVEKDIEAVKQCDYIICFWDESAEKGAGTQGEITLAKFLNKPVFLVSKFEFSKIPSWIIGCVDKIFYDFEQLKDFLYKKFKPSNESNKSGD